MQNHELQRDTIQDMGTVSAETGITVLRVAKCMLKEKVVEKLND